MVSRLFFVSTFEEASVPTRRREQTSKLRSRFREVMMPILGQLYLSERKPELGELMN